MSCEKLQPELVAYHFGVVSAETRCSLEEHLVTCPACVAAFLAIKRDIETAGSGPSPSPAARHRLRRAVARELGIGETRRRWSWWERPLALGFASVAVLLAILATSVVGGSPGTMPHTLLDQAPASRTAPTRAP